MLQRYEQMKIRTYRDVKEWRIQDRIKKLQMCVDYKGGKCEVCKTPYSKDLFHFHHVNRNEKSFGIAGNLTRSWENLKKELDKCQLLCVNCHRATYSNHFLTNM
jgi:hypothetical protein